MIEVVVKNYRNITGEGGDNFTSEDFKKLEECNAAFIIKGVFSTEELAAIKSKIPDLQNTRTDLHNKMGFTYPTTIYLLDTFSKDELQKKYFNYTRKLIDDSDAELGFDMKKIFDLLASICKVSSLHLLKDESQTKHYFAPLSLRYLHPSFGEMTFHCEKDLKRLSSYFYSNTKNQISDRNIFSFFLMVNKPTEGGLFSIFDMKQHDVKQKLSDTEVKLHNNKVVNIENDIQPNLIELAPGDLLLFNGGELWHRAEIVLGKEPRITLGGFLAEGLNDGKMYVWS
ncbi:MAG: hypothetical protein U0X41_12510 [Chitinophagales bacterium]